MDVKAQQPWKMRGLWLWIVAALVLLGSGFAAFQMLMLSRQNTVAEAPVAPSQVTVEALGRLEPKGEVIDVSGPSGDRILRMEVAEGDSVKQGAILAYLEAYGERLAERNYAASKLAEAQFRFRAETQYGRMQVQEAQTRFQQVDRPQSFEIQAQLGTVRQLEAQLSLAQVDLNRFQGLQREGAISQQDLDQQVTEVHQLQEQLNSARANLIRLESSRNSNLNNAQAQVQSAQAEVTRSQSQTEVESSVRNLQLAEARLERTLIRAPQNGEILRILTHPGEAIGDQGILQMGNTQQMFVVAEIYETDVGRVSVGQRATVESRNGAFDAILSNAPVLTGSVARIGSQVFKNNILDDDPAANADSRVVEVRIRLDQGQLPPAQSKRISQLTNLQVNVCIEVDPGSCAVQVQPTPTPTQP